MLVAGAVVRDLPQRSRARRANAADDRIRGRAFSVIIQCSVIFGIGEGGILAGREERQGLNAEIVVFPAAT